MTKTAQSARNAAHLFGTGLMAVLAGVILGSTPIGIGNVATNQPRVWNAMNISAAPQILQRIRAEYLEMPGLTLRSEQVQRLCGVDRELCESVLETLVDSGFLSRRPDGAYGRYRNPDIARLRPAKAALEPSVQLTRSGGRVRAS